MRPGLLVLLLAALLGCRGEPQLPPVVVYAPEDSDLESLFADFTADTGIPVTPIWGDSAFNTDRLISKANDNADVLITNNVADIWRAAERGALRPISSAALADIDAVLKDPDRSWATVSIRFHAIGMAKSDSDHLAASFNQLANPDMNGRVCLSSSRLPANRSLLALLINDLGLKDAERLVRRWMRNLAVYPYASQEDLVTAMLDGTCDYGIVSSNPAVEGIEYFLPEERYFDIDGIGVARHAKQAESAQGFVDWVLRHRTVHLDAELPSINVGIAGWHDEDARLLAERAGYH